MKKIESIWRELLFQRLVHKRVFFRQQELAQDFQISSSTVNLALQPLKQLGGVRIGGRGFEVTDVEKILYHWANHHRLTVHSQFRVNLPLLEIEGRLPDQTITTAYTAVREQFGESPADYAKIYCYHSQPQLIKERFQNEIGVGPANLFITLSDIHMARYGSQISLGQLFVDLWNLSDWYAKDFVKIVKTKIDELLS